MKRIGNLYNKIISRENILHAYNNAIKNKRNTYGVKIFNKDFNNNISKLHEELFNKTYKTGEYFLFKINKPKERVIYRLDFKHRIVHHAIMNILEPIWVKIFTRDTYSCIKKRGIHGCLKELKKDLKNKELARYCLKLDIQKFYPNINHAILKNIISRKIKCKDALCLLYEIIDSAPGVPIGNYLSQYFANLYLAYFDHWIKEHKKVKYYRYCDDMVILGNNKDELHKLKIDIENYLSNYLDLKLKPNYQVFPIKDRGIDFIGYVFFNTHIKLRKSIKKAMIKKRHNRKSLTSYYGWCIHCNSRNLLKKLNVYENIFRQSA